MGKRQDRGQFITGRSKAVAKAPRFVTSQQRCDQEYRVLQTREPGGTVVAEAIRQIPAHFIIPGTDHAQHRSALDPRGPMSARHARDWARAATWRGRAGDRFSDSTFAYQGFGRGLDLAWLRTANAMATNGSRLTSPWCSTSPFALACPGEAVEGKQNRLDRESERFHRLVRKGFLHLPRKHPRITIVNTNRPEETIRAELEIVLGWIARTAANPRR